MQLFQALKGHQVWVRRVEHFVLRVVSLAFSLASAHAIRWFFAPLDRVDVLQPTITWMIAIGFGVLGYFVSRGLAHRLMNKERILAYAPICLVVEFVEIFCNYALAAAVIQRATWLEAIPEAQRVTLTTLTYVVLAIIPLVSVLLAVVDMDLERSKSGAQSPWAKPQPKAYANGGNQPKVVLGGGNSQAAYGAPAASYPMPAYGQGYQGKPGVAPIPQGGKNGASPFSPVQVTP